jgi:hypothetical protein
MLTEELFSKVAPAKTRLAKRYHSGRGHKFAGAKVQNILYMTKGMQSFLPFTTPILRFFNIIVYFLTPPKRQKGRKEVKIRRQNNAMCVRGKICNP